MRKEDKHFEEWTTEEREEWIREYLAGQPVIRPLPEHDPGECDHCDGLQALQDEADARKDTAT